VNNGLPGGADDTLYKANERVLPAVGTAVTLSLSPRVQPGAPER